METKEEPLEVKKEPIKCEMLDMINSICNDFTALEGFSNSLSEKHSEVDRALNDLYHFAEYEKLTTGKQAQKFYGLVANFRNERRTIKNNLEMKRVYEEHKQKIIYDTQRQFFLQVVNQKAKELNSEYKYKYYSSADEIKELLK